MNSPSSRQVLTRMLSRPEASAALRAAGHGFREAVKYYLPKLLMQPIWHCFLYFDYIKVGSSARVLAPTSEQQRRLDVVFLFQVLHKRTPNSEDGETLEQVQGLLSPLKMAMLESVANCPKKDCNLRIQSRARRQAAFDKTSELQKSVDGWDQRDVGQCCNEFIRGNDYIQRW